MTNTTIPAGKLRHALLWSTAILYLLFSPLVYYHLFPQREGKPIEVLKAPPEENGRIRFNIESLIYWSNNLVAYQEGETYAFNGWAFLNEGANTKQAEYDRFVIVYNDANAFVFPMKVFRRPDVQDAFKDLGLNDLAGSGFNAVISRNALTVGEYKIGLLFKNKQDGTSYYLATDRILERTPNHLVLKPKK